MGSNCCLSLQNQERSWLAGFLTVLQHSLFLDTNETAHLGNEECSLSGLFIHIHCDVDLHATAPGSMQTATVQYSNHCLNSTYTVLLHFLLQQNVYSLIQPYNLLTSYLRNKAYFLYIVWVLMLRRNTMLHGS